MSDCAENFSSAGVSCCGAMSNCLCCARPIAAILGWMPAATDAPRMTSSAAAPRTNRPTTLVAFIGFPLRGLIYVRWLGSKTNENLNTGMDFDVFIKVPRIIHAAVELMVKWARGEGERFGRHDGAARAFPFSARRSSKLHLKYLKKPSW